MIGRLSPSLAVMHYKRMDMPAPNAVNFNFLLVYSMGLGPFFFFVVVVMYSCFTVFYTHRLSTTLLYRNPKFIVLGGHLALANVPTTSGDAV